MPLQFLLDENVPRGVLTAIYRHNKTGQDILNVLCVGEPEDLPLGSEDSVILGWAEQQDRVLITQDKRPMPVHLAAHLSVGRHCPGILMLTEGFSINRLIEYLVLIAYASEAVEWQDRIEYIA